MKKLKEINKKNKNFLLSLILITLFPYIFSCTVISKEIGNQVIYNDEYLEPEITHYREVLTILGPPSKISKYNDGLVFLYERINIKERQLGFGFSEDLFRWIKFSFARGSADRSLLVMIFNQNGLLIEKQYARYDEKIGSGQGINIIISMQSLVDTSNLEDNSDTLLWGKSLLNLLPEILNIPNNLKSGERGIEQTGTPSSVGQHTLELEE